MGIHYDSPEYIKVKEAMEHSRKVYAEAMAEVRKQAGIFMSTSAKIIFDQYPHLESFSWSQGQGGWNDNGHDGFTLNISSEWLELYPTPEIDQKIKAEIEALRESDEDTDRGSEYYEGEPIPYEDTYIWSEENKMVPASDTLGMFYEPFRTIEKFLEMFEGNTLEDMFDEAVVTVARGENGEVSVKTEKYYGE